MEKYEYVCVRTGNKLREQGWRNVEDHGTKGRQGRVHGRNGPKLEKAGVPPVDQTREGLSRQGL